MSDGHVCYDIMICQDGVTRAVPVINGEKQDPTYKNMWKKEKPEKDEKDEKKEKPKVTIQDRIQGQVEDYISAVEGIVDNFIKNDYKLKYDCYAHLSNLGCKAVHARKMRQFYIDCFNELVDVYNKDDEYYLEAWSHLKPKYHKKMMDFYGIICDDIDRLIKNATAQRKPRKKKTLSAERLVKKIKYQVEFPELKLVSVNPEKIIGANELWVYNTKYNRLGVYRAENSIRGFSVKGTTLLHFDETESVEKTVRKPKEALANLKKGALKKALNSMKTQEKQLKGRIGKDTILLGAFF